MTKRLQQTPPTLGPKGIEMRGKPGHWYHNEPEFNEKIIVEQWDCGDCYESGWRLMDGSHCVYTSKPFRGLRQAANSAARWIDKRSKRYAALGVK